MLTAPRAILGTFVAVHVINDFYATVLPAFLPALAREWDLDYTELGLLSFAFTLFTGVLQPLIGHVADKQGKRKLILSFGFFIGGSGFLLMAVAPSFWFITVVSLLCGLGAAAYHPQATAFVVSAYPNDRGRMLGIHGWGGSVGHFLAPAIATVAIAALDWRWAMVIVAVPIIGAGTGLWAYLPESSPNPEAALKGALGRPIVVAALAFGLLNTVLYSFVTFVVKMLVDEGWAEVTAGATLTIMLFIGVVAQPVGGRIYDRFGGRNLFVCSKPGNDPFGSAFLPNLRDCVPRGRRSYSNLWLRPISCISSNRKQDRW